MSESTELAVRSTTAISPMQVIADAVQSGQMSVDVVERLVALEERITERNARMAMLEALAAFQSECPVIQHNSQAKIATKAGGSYGYRYASLDHIAATIRPLLRKHGLAYSWDTTLDGSAIVTTCTLTHVDGHQMQSSFTAPTETRAQMSGAQSAASANTYAKRQSLVSVLGLTTADEDTDGAVPQQAKAAGPISKADIAKIQAKMTEVGADPERFLAFLGVDSLELLPASRVREALAALEQKGRAA